MAKPLTGSQRLIRAIRVALIVLVLAIAAGGIASIWEVAVSRAYELTGTGLVAAFVVLWLLWMRARPRARRDWIPDHERMPDISIEGDEIVIDGFRERVYEEDARVEYSRRTIPLGDVVSADFILEVFASWRGMAHIFLSFGLASGEYVSISAEARRRKGQGYDPIRGLLRTYQLIYVIGEETDVVGLRTNLRASKTFLYPLKLERETVQRLFVSMLERARELKNSPEYYNTLTNSCASSLVFHLEELSGKDLGFELRALLPGYSDRLACELGLLDVEGKIEPVRDRFRVEALPTDGLAPAEWSRRLRSGRGSSPAVS